MLIHNIARCVNSLSRTRVCRDDSIGLYNTEQRERDNRKTRYQKLLQIVSEDEIDCMRTKICNFNACLSKI